MKDPERVGYRIVGGRELRKGYTKIGRAHV